MIVRLTDVQREALQVGRHLVVRANAGSGKTFVLTHRLMWLLVEHGVPLDRLVAITFTKKAAAEMRQRVQALLLNVREDEEQRASLGFSKSDSAVIGCIDNTLKDIGRARISTFHSFAAGLVRSHGPDLGVDPESRDLADRELNHLITSSVRSAIREAMRTGVITPAHELLGIGNTEQRVKDFARSGEHLDRLVSWYESLGTPLTRYRTQIVPAAFNSLLRSLGQNVYDELISLDGQSTPEGNARCAALVQSLHALEHDASSSALATNVVDQLLDLYTKESTARKRHKVFKRCAELSPLPTTWKSILDWSEELGEEHEARQAQAFEAVLAVACDAERRFTEIKRRRAVIDYDDTMRLAVRLLRDNTSIAKGIRGSFDYLMIDEFQDTNPLQYELVKLLVPELDGHSGKCPELFVVGDDKQGIYGFRNADVRLFREVEGAITQANILHHPTQLRSSLTLAESRRMTPELADHVNTICHHAFADGESSASEFDVPYVELISVREPTHAESSTSFRVSLRVKTNGASIEQGDEVSANDGDSDENADDDTADEIDEIVARIQHMLNGTDTITLDTGDGSEVRLPMPSDIAVLLARRNSVSDLARHLQSVNIPVNVHGGRAFFTRPEIADIRNLLLVLADTGNSLALAALLRSPLFRLTDADLVQITSADTSQRFSWDGLRTCALQHGDQHYLAAPYHVINELASFIHHHPIDEVIRMALRRCEWHGTLIEDPRREQVLDNVAKLMDIVRTTSDIPGATLYDIIEAISVPDGTDNESESSVSAGGYGVSVMTLHASKGLEFPIVIVADISSKPPSSSFDQSDELGPTFSLSTKQPVTAVDVKPPALKIGASHHANKVVASLKSKAEAKRLLYVALTRAKAHLLILVSANVNAQGELTTQGRLSKLVLPLVDSVPHAPALEKVTTPVTRSISKPPVIPLPDPIVERMNRGVVNVTDLVDETTAVFARQRVHEREHGIRVHEAISSVLRGDWKATTHSDPIVQRFLDARSAWDGIPHDAEVERERVAMLDDTVVVGRPDVLFVDQTGDAHIWDWKVAEPDGSIGLQQIVEHYLPQLMGYAWLIMQGRRDIAAVHTRLAFVPQATDQLDEWSAVRTFTRNDLVQIEAAIRSRIAVPAA